MPSLEPRPSVLANHAGEARPTQAAERTDEEAMPRVKGEAKSKRSSAGEAAFPRVRGEANSMRPSAGEVAMPRVRRGQQHAAEHSRGAHAKSEARPAASSRAQVRRPCQE